MDYKDEITGLFVTLNPSGYPERIGCKRTEKELKKLMDDAFVNYVSEEIELSGNSDYLPESQVCQFVFDSQMLSEEQLHQFALRGHELMPFLKEHQIKPVRTCALRAFANPAYRNDGMHTFGICGRKNVLDIIESPNGKDKLAEFRTFDQAGWEPGIIAVECSGKRFYFQDTGRGKSCIQALFKYVAENFFSPQIQKLKGIRIVNIPNPTVVNKESARHYIEMFSLLDGTFLPGKSFWEKLDAGETLKGDHYPITVDYKTYQHFLEDFSFKATDQNKLIALLLYVRNYGTPDGLPIVGRRYAIEALNPFKELDKSLSQAMDREPHNEKMLENLQSGYKTIAQHILKTSYGIDNVDCIETRVPGKTNTPKNRIHPKPHL